MSDDNPGEREFAADHGDHDHAHDCTCGDGPDLVAGALAGALGGILAGFVKLGWEEPFPPRPEGREPEPAVLIEKITHEKAPQAGVFAIHFGFSVASAALYGALAEVLPITTVGFGSVYGLAVWLGAHEFAMPAMGLTPPAAELPLREHLSESVGHAVWGTAIEAVRLVVRGR